MKKTIALLLMILCLFAVVSCKGKTAENAAVASISESDSISEKYWYLMGEDLIAYYTDYYSQYYDDFDVSAMARGIKDYADGNFTLTTEEMDKIASDYYAYQEEKQSSLASENLAKAEQFLSENAQKEGVETTESGLQYKVLTQGTGSCPAIDDVVEVNYELSLMDGTVVESTYSYGQTAQFGLTGVISGFAEGLMLMPVGSTYQLFIHPDLGYGSNATSALEANSVLIFKVELVSIVED